MAPQEVSFFRLIAPTAPFFDQVVPKDTQTDPKGQQVSKMDAKRTPRMTRMDPKIVRMVPTWFLKQVSPPKGHQVIKIDAKRTCQMPIFEKDSRECTNIISRK